MASQTKAYISPEEYLSIERKTEQKSEYLHGTMVAMGGASERHNLIAGNIFASLHRQMGGRPCKVYTNDMRVKGSATGTYTYPDVVALRGETRFDDQQRDTLINPAVIVEVLSESTEAYDRGEKSENYRKLESLVEYLFVAQDRVHIEHYVRQDDNAWLLSQAGAPGDAVNLLSIECSLLLSEIYDKVDIGEDDPGATAATRSARRSPV